MNARIQVKRDEPETPTRRHTFDKCNNKLEGQSEGAMAIGLSKKVIFFKIILPQAIAKMYPSLVGQFIFLFLTTGIISEIGVQDLTHAGLFIDSRSFRSFEVFITLTVLYIFLSLFFKYVLARANLKFFPYLKI